MRRITLLVLILLVAGVCDTNAQPGKWEQHLALGNISKVVSSTNRVYFASDRGVIYYDRTDNSTGSLTKNSGLSESNIKTIGFNTQANTLIIIYENCCIDLCTESGLIVPILDLKRKVMSTNKTVNSIYSKGGTSYFACSFGILEFDVEKREIKGTYIIGKNGSYVNVNGVTTDDEHIYAATDEGLYVAKLSSNLLDFNNWAVVDNSELPSGKYLFCYNSNGTLYCGYCENEDYDFANHIYKLYTIDNKWHREWWSLYAFREMQFVTDDIVAIAADYSFQIYSISSGQVQNISKYPFLQDDLYVNSKSIYVDEYGVAWLADGHYGAIRYENESFSKIEIVGPTKDGAAWLSYENGMLWMSYGNISASWGNSYFQPLLQYFDGTKWGYFDKTNMSELTDVRDIYCTAVVPGSPNHLFASAYGYGLLEINDGKLVNHYTPKNSNIMNASGTNDITYVGGMDFDSEGNLWISNSLAEKNLHCLKNDGSWKSFSLPEIASDYFTGKVLVSSHDIVWTIIPRGKTYGLYAMSTDGSYKKHLDVKSYFSNGEESVIASMNDVYDIVEDLDGDIWVGTSIGIIVYSNPAYVFEQSPFYGYRPSVNKNDGIYHPLLETDAVSSIAVDGSNQKWIGTKGSGLYLVSADGTEEIEHFTTDNSSLISDVITSLAYNGDDGILYIGTDNGLVSYKTKSRNAYSGFSNVYAYPNPVRPGYEGDIYINGLMYNTNVKITTISGRLVYETTSEGGRAVWPGTDLAGNRVHSGVYMVFCASEDGTQSEAAKILFIR